MDVGVLLGHCFCRAVAYTVDVSDLSNLTLSAYCHCTKCQRLNGAPFVFSTHWKEAAVQWFPAPAPATAREELDEQQANGGQGIEAQVERMSIEDTGATTAKFSPGLATFETMPGRKWKLRCRKCGTPMGSWNQAKREWTIWPSTLERTDPDGEGPIEGLLLLAPNEHQFYGAWRMLDIQDGLPKWDGYADKSNRVAEVGGRAQ